MAQPFLQTCAGNSKDHLMRGTTGSNIVGAMGGDWGGGGDVGGEGEEGASGFDGGVVLQDTHTGT